MHRILTIICKISISGVHDIRVTETNCEVIHVNGRNDVEKSGRDHCYIKHLMQRGTKVCQSLHRIIRTKKSSLIEISLLLLDRINARTSIKLKPFCSLCSKSLQKIDVLQDTAIH